MNARFWTWENGGWVKLTLAPGQSVKWSKFSTDEEGWSRETTRWTHEGSHVRRESGMTGRDCDGGIGRGGADHCPISRLMAVEPYRNSPDEFAPEGRPDWQEVEPAWQYDEQAELANY